MPAPATSLSDQPPSYLFVAAKADGRRTLGVRPAADEGVLARELGAERLILVRSVRIPGWLSGGDEPLGLKDQAELTGQLAQLLDRGVPLVEALEVTAEAVSNKSSSKVRRVRDLVNQGRSFAAASLEANAFDTVTAAVFESAERTGDLAGAAKQLARNAKRRLKIAESAKTLLFYPLIVLAVSSMVGIFMLTIVVPMVADAMEDVMNDGQSLPTATVVLAAAGRWLRDNALIALGIAAAVAVAAALLRGVIGSTVLGVARRLPVFKELTLAQESARFFSVMAAMSRGGVPLADALGVANQTVSHPKLRGELDRLRSGLIDGGLLRTLLEAVASLPLATRRLLIAADRAGDLDTAFESLAEDHTEAVDRQSTRLLAVLEPALIVLIFLLIGSMIIALIAPMLSLSRSAFGGA
ncbi:MAG: type II secretion system F family protein [Planctomycetota bacterium]